jgi:hypothetical protein
MPFVVDLGVEQTQQRLLDSKMCLGQLPIIINQRLAGFSLAAVVVVATHSTTTLECNQEALVDLGAESSSSEPIP